MPERCQHSTAFDCTSQPAACCPDWMAELPDALPLSHLSIPGTHDSLSLFGGRRLRCQSWGLEAQLAAGVRFLDVRCKLVRGELHVYHLCTFQRASLRGVLRRTLRFLRAHPGEAVLMRIKEELPIFSRPGFATWLHRCLLEEGQDHVWCKEEVPTLGQVRGKIVVLEALAREVLGIPYEQLSISDAWNVLSLERKWARARRHLERAAAGDHATMHLTFCSGNGLFTCPEDVARFVNPRCYQHLQRRRGQPMRWGVVILDFPGAGLLRLIMESNAPWAGRHIQAAPGAPLRHSCSRRDRGRRRHGSAHHPRRCPAERLLLPAPCLCRRTSAPVKQKWVPSSG
ncbi:1-phosphatidylinositol phosphodiesterase-like [Indicator indicator]|uniref:1-phosphatidylinositol phosphodiesterase-like n=1 Tax=Indicator indicator TaxID=1002788 RepID=UPI0023DFE900|nr:1-phosphatidylinositol phosphodiesterase-like [Indicator indicator]